MNDFLKKVLITLAVVASIAVVCVLLSMRDVEDFHEKYDLETVTKQRAEFYKEIILQKQIDKKYETLLNT